MVEYNNTQEEEIIAINMDCRQIVRKHARITPVLQDLLLDFVGCFQTSSALLDEIYGGVRGFLDFANDEFSYYSNWRPKFLMDDDGPRWVATGERLGALFDTIVFVGDRFFYKPYFICVEDGELIDETDEICEFVSPMGIFTGGEILQLMFECEKQRRPKTKWCGGPDYSHVHFEGFYDTQVDPDNIVWGVRWGS